MNTGVLKAILTHPLPAWQVAIVVALVELINRWGVEVEVISRIPQ